ncbi:CDP-glycerol glycerophosphotransferase family protein [Porphyromonadaceae bacterium OttesenSCG-928-L07]|nr:CDP-glycerol glycerophosphotransferase family protein [Porphyromonadaceae bacterium OttesenSCG-928-L07]MDL2251268.1 CDP-glycerol glycerophosphotransferase family protein [Odoribacter sp. OttesenSCG-928-J03]
MRIVLFCENKYSINILSPIQEEALKNTAHSVLWYVHTKNIPDFPLKSEVNWTDSIQKVYDYSPEAIFVPGNIVPYYLPGVKIQVFHGYAAEKKDHWVIRRYFDTYFTQGPFFTRGFQTLSQKYKDFEVKETGWPRQDWIYNNLHTFDTEKQALLEKHNKSKLVLFAPTFSPSLTSLPHIKEGLVRLVREKDVLLILKFHPLTKKEWMDEYRELAIQHENMLWIEDHNITKYQLMADVMISDTSSTVYEFLLLNKPVITYNTIAKEIYWIDINDPQQLPEAFEKALHDEEYAEKRKWIIDNYDPYLDGKVCQRMLHAAEDYIVRKSVPAKRRLNLWRKYTSIKRFGKIKKSK